MQDSFRLSWAAPRDGGSEIVGRARRIYGCCGVYGLGVRVYGLWFRAVAQDMGVPNIGGALFGALLKGFEYGYPVLGKCPYGHAGCSLGVCGVRACGVEGVWGTGLCVMVVAILSGWAQDLPSLAVGYTFPLPSSPPTPYSRNGVYASFSTGNPSILSSKPDV